MFRNVLVHIPSERPVRSVVDVAINLTLGGRAHLDAIAIGYESVSALGITAEGGGAAVAAAVGYEQERALERANAAISVFEVEAKLAKIPYGVRALAAVPAEAEELIGRLSRFYDLTIVSQPESSIPSYDNYIPQGVLFNSGGPFAMVPYIHKGPLDARHVGIAWDGSRLAARAVHDALPFLTAARAVVTVIAVNEERDDMGEWSSDQLVGDLARRDIKGRRWRRLTADRGDGARYHFVDHS
ncbi:MAG: hypothetical protein QM743_05345 [Chitinophagaceae bacterium]